MSVRDTRKHPRLEVMIPCGVQLSKQMPPDAWGRVNDLSVGGVEFHTFFKVEKGQTVFLTFHVDTAFVFTHVKGTVVRVREQDGYYYAGVMLDDAVDREHVREAMQFLIERT